MQIQASEEMPNDYRHIRSFECYKENEIEGTKSLIAKANTNTNNFYIYDKEALKAPNSFFWILKVSHLEQNKFCGESGYSLELFSPDNGKYFDLEIKDKGETIIFVSDDIPTKVESVTCNLEVFCKGDVTTFKDHNIGSFKKN